MIPSIRKGYFFFTCLHVNSTQTVTEGILWMYVVFPESYAKAFLISA